MADTEVCPLQGVRFGIVGHAGAAVGFDTDDPVGDRAKFRGCADVVGLTEDEEGAVGFLVESDGEVLTGVAFAPKGTAHGGVELSTGACT